MPLTKAKIKTAQGSQRFFSTLYNEMVATSNTPNDTLLFIHGFSTSWQKTLRTVKELATAYCKAPSPIKRIVVFSWPSDGTILDYKDDYRDAEVSGYALGRALLKLTDFLTTFIKSPQNSAGQEACRNNIHLICHSMGNFVLESALAMMLNSKMPLRSVFKEVVLVAADVAWNALQTPNPLYHITALCERTHVYYNKNDKALWASETLKNPANRLGKFGPEQASSLPQNVSVVDVTPIVEPSLLEHSYFTDNRIIADITEVFKSTPSGKIHGREFVQYRNIFRLMENEKAEPKMTIG